MINLIPNEEKKKKVKDFYFRLVSVFFTVLAVSIFVAVFTLLPSYFFSTVKKNSANAKLEIQKNEPTPTLDQKTLTLINDLNNKLTLVERSEQDKYLVSFKIVSGVILKKMPDIKITEITYENNSSSVKTVGIHGIAPNRERLLLFERTLADDPFFKNVDLPVSNYIKGTNIQFYLNLTPY